MPNIFLFWLSLNLTWVIKKCLNLTFKVIFLCQKSAGSIWFFLLKNIKLGVQVLKNENNKELLLYWYSSMKNIRKIWMIFDIENWLWKSDLGTFWWPLWTSVKVKSKDYFSFIDYFAKIKPLLTHVLKTPPLRSH